MARYSCRGKATNAWLPRETAERRWQAFSWLPKPFRRFATCGDGIAEVAGWAGQGDKAAETACDNVRQQKLRKKSETSTLNLVGSTLHLAEHSFAVLAVFSEHVDTAHGPQQFEEHSRSQLLNFGLCHSNGNLHSLEKTRSASRAMVAMAKKTEKVNHRLSDSQRSGFFLLPSASLCFALASLALKLWQLHDCSRPVSTAPAVLRTYQICSAGRRFLVMQRHTTKHRALSLVLP